MRVKKSDLKTFTVILAVVAFCVATLSYANIVKATETFSCIKVRQQIISDPSYAKPKWGIHYTLEALEKDAPMPDDTKGTYGFWLKGDDEKNLYFKLTKAGDYHYKLYQNEIPDSSKLSHDERQYSIHIRGVNTPEGFVVETLITDNSNHKISELSFENKYIGGESDLSKNTGNKPKTGDNEDIIAYLLSLVSVILCLVALLLKRKQDENPCSIVNKK